MVSFFACLCFFFFPFFSHFWFHNQNKTITLGQFSCKLVHILTYYLLSFYCLSNSIWGYIRYIVMWIYNYFLGPEFVFGSKPDVFSESGLVILSCLKLTEHIQCLSHWIGSGELWILFLSQEPVVCVLIASLPPQHLTLSDF